MMSWWKRDQPVAMNGAVLFRGRWAPRPEDFISAERFGVRAGAAQRSERGFVVPLEHPKWGAAQLHVVQGATLHLPTVVLDHDPRLSEDEKTAFRACQTEVRLSMTGGSGNVLADRKSLLGYLHAVGGAEYVGAIDITAQAFWSRQAIAEELSHDAELDIDSIYTQHFITDGGRPYWLHTHGFSEIGFTDFDVLEPSRDLAGHAHELIRGLAFAIVEGRLSPSGEPHQICERSLPVRAVAARDFLDAAPADQWRHYRESNDDHVAGHAILCDPAATGGVFSRLLRRDRPRPSGFLQGPFPEQLLVRFSSSATSLMAGRAARMLPVLRECVAEFAEFRFGVLVKLGYAIDGGGPNDREHIWFEVHGFGADTVDATLINTPFRIARLKDGTRAEHSLELLSDWAIFTPFGRIDPRQTQVLRFVRDNKSHLRELIDAQKSRA